jgi:hypothetical protein
VETEAAKTPEGITPIMLKGLPRDFECNNTRKNKRSNIKN